MLAFKNTRADTVFIGGGTPTILPDNLLDKLLFSVHDIFNLSDNTEISVEANPKTLTPDKLSLLKQYVNRLSIGVQSFNDNELKLIGRVHSAKDACETLSLAGKYFNNINMDLMASLPSQTIESLEYSLRTAVSLSPAHISCYSLIIEENTPIYEMYKSGVLKFPDEDADRDMYDMTREYLALNGYNRYEISNYAKNGFECRHNIKYWNCDEYIGFGVSAHSYRNKRRYFNSGIMKEYLNRAGGGENILSDNDMMSEFVFMGMRKMRGISKSEFKKRFSVDIYDVYGDIIWEKIQKRLICEKGDFLYLSDRGIDISNYVLCDFILD